MTHIRLKTPGPFVMIGGESGHTVIPVNTPLTRLHFFNGKFLQAEDLELDQQAQRYLTMLSNQAGGSGVVHGFSARLAGGDSMQVSQGLAIDPLGRVLFLPQNIMVGITQLIEESRRARSEAAARRAGSLGKSGFKECEVRTETPPAEIGAPAGLYVVTVGHAEAYCGEEDVYGKLCEEACVTSTERPYIIEGIVIRALPLTDLPALPDSAVVGMDTHHLRSRVASAFFGWERRRIPHLISGEGLMSPLWCLGAQAETGQDVPIALLARVGSNTLFLDRWIVCRERMETPPRHYWAWRMAMRPWNVFLAQVLQFQCQLTELFALPAGPEDPCAEEKKILLEISSYLQNILKTEDLTNRPDLKKQLEYYQSEAQLAGQEIMAPGYKGGHGILIDGGIIELPSAGYLPVNPAAREGVEAQVRRMMGKGVDLRFCRVRPDFVAHALEEAQHMERISLTQGLDDPSRKPEVDILVPGELETKQVVQEEALIFEVDHEIYYIVEGDRHVSFHGRGIGRVESLVNGGAAFHFGGWIRFNSSEPGGSPSPFYIWSTMRCEGDPFQRLSSDIPAHLLALAVMTDPKSDAAILIGALDLSGELKLGADKSEPNAKFGQFIGTRKEMATGDLDVDLAVGIRPSEHGRKYIGGIDGEQRNTFSVEWTNEAKTADVRLELDPRAFGDQGTQSPSPIWGIRLVRNLDIIKEGSKLRTEIENNITKLGQAESIDKWGFDPEIAKQRLFRPLTSTVERTTSKSNADWVLFHRRRTKECKEESVPNVPEQTPPKGVVVLAKPTDDWVCIKFDDSTRGLITGPGSMVFEEVTFTSLDSKILPNIDDSVTGPGVALVVPIYGLSIELPESSEKVRLRFFRPDEVDTWDSEHKEVYLQLKNASGEAISQWIKRTYGSGYSIETFTTPGTKQIELNHGEFYLRELFLIEVCWVPDKSG